MVRIGASVAHEWANVFLGTFVLVTCIGTTSRPDAALVWQKPGQLYLPTDWMAGPDRKPQWLWLMTA